MIVVCDTNIYRSLNSSIFDIWKKKECQKKIKVKLCTVVAAELISHLDSSDKKNVICFEALKKMNRHCNCPSSKWMPLPEGLIAKQYFNSKTDIISEYQRNIDILVSHVEEYEDVSQFNSEYVNAINDVKSYLCNIENIFVAMMNGCKYIYNSFHLSCENKSKYISFTDREQNNFEKLIVYGQLLEVAKCIGLKEKMVTCELVERYADEHKPQLKMWCDLLKKLLKMVLNPKKGQIICGIFVFYFYVEFTMRMRKLC